MATRLGHFVLLLSATACGPDASSLSEASDVDSDESATSESELSSLSRAARWFPLDPGNAWTFESASGTRTVQLRSASDGMAEIDGLFERPVWVGVNPRAPNTLLHWHEPSRAWRAWFRFGFASSTWTVGTEACSGAKLRRAATGIATHTPAGLFVETRTISIAQIPSAKAFCTPPALAEVTFAAGVGMVAFRTGTGERFSLRSAVVAGSPVPAAQGVTAILKLDRNEYRSKPNTIRCITIPCVSNHETAVAQATFTVSNEGTSAQTWQFRTSCEVDIELVTAGGLRVKRLADERTCTTGLRSLILKPGETKTWNEPVTLSDREGLQLDGVFTMRARLNSSAVDAAVPGAMTSFNVRVE